MRRRPFYGNAPIDFAAKLVIADRGRFLTTVSGVAFAVTLVYVQVGIFLGMLDNASVMIDRLDADLWVTSRNTANIDFANTFPENYVQRVRSVPGVARADNLLVWFVAVSLPDGGKESALVYGLEDFVRWGYPWRVEEGSAADLRRGKCMMLDESARRRFGPFAVGQYREIHGLRLKIVGRTEEARSFTTNPIAFVDYRVAQALEPLELTGQTTFIVAKLEPGADAEAVRAEIARRLPHNDVRTRAEWSERSRRYWVRNTGLGLSMYVTVFLGGLVGVVIVAQTLHASTVAHRREYAMIKAIGGTDATIYRILVKTASIAAVLGFGAGVALAHASRPALALLDLKVILPPEMAIDIFLATLGLCVAASALSFRRVAGLDPAAVFRS